MKFLAIAALAIVAAQDEETPAEEPAAACAEGECNVTDSETGETACTAQADVDASEGALVCDPEAVMEEEGSNTLFASVAAVAVAATLMY